MHPLLLKSVAGISTRICGTTITRNVQNIMWSRDERERSMLHSQAPLPVLISVSKVSISVVQCCIASSVKPMLPGIKSPPASYTWKRQFSSSQSPDWILTIWPISKTPKWLFSTSPITLQGIKSYLGTKLHLENAVCHCKQIPACCSCLPFSLYEDNKK